ncbi:MAG: ABC transporter permease [Candidatus Enterenecus sp.]
MKKSGFITIFRKELARFFGDRRMALTTVLLPGLLIFVLYSFMGDAFSKQFSVSDDFVPRVQAVGLPGSIAALGAEAGVEFSPAEDIEAAKALVTDKELHALVVFPEDFDALAAAYSPASGQPAPAVELYYNSADTDSSTAYQIMSALLDSYESALANKFDVNPGGEGYDLATEEDTAGTLFASMLPMLLMMFLFSGCMSVAPESIAGEKERGTIATLLVTPLKRSHLALGKICALSIIALLAGASSTIGTLASLPKLMALGGDITVPYGPAHYLALTVIILSTVLLIVAAISVVSAFAKSIKEAQTYITPLMIVSTLVGVTAMFGGGPQERLPMYLIPIYNSVQAMVGIFSFQMVPARLILTILSNLAFTGAGVFLLTRMFRSEKIMFQR